MFLNFVGFMQQLGYYNRPQATLVYLLWVILAFSFFAANLWLFYREKIGKKYLIASVVVNFIILVFAYPFLSYDVFNYMFDAKILWAYHLSPYTHKALDFPQDDWIRFMRWTHRFSPYGPLWLALSLIPTIVGFGKFIITLIAFKIFIGSFHILNSLIIYKILKKINPKIALLGTAFYALNPLFLIEGVVNAHNDVVFSVFILASILFAINKNLSGFLSLVAGALIKYISILNVPWIFLMAIKKINTNQLILLSLATMAAFTFVFSTFTIQVPFISSGSTQVQFQPWYLFWTLPLAALISKRVSFLIAGAIGFGALLRYLPYLYNGDWSHPNTIKFMEIALFTPIIIVPIALFVLSGVKSETHK